MELLFGILDVLDVFVGLVLVVAAIVSGLQCRQRKIGAGPAWVLVGGFSLMLLASAGMAISNLVLTRALAPDQFEAYRVVMLLFYVVNLMGLVGVAAGMAMFKAPKAHDAEVANG